MAEHKTQSTIISQEIPCDLTTPVQALLKVKDHFKDYHFLYESVENGTNKGRHSVIGLMPDLVFKSQSSEALINRNVNNDPNAFTKIQDKNPLISLRNLINECQINVESGPNNSNPFLSSGIFGYMSYDMVRLMEDIKDSNLTDEIKIPDSIFIRPQILIIFDNLFDVATISAPIYHTADLDLKEAQKNAQSNIKKIIKLLNKPLSLQKKSTQKQDRNFTSSSSKEQYCQMVNKSKEYIKEGDVFQVLPSLRVCTPFKQEDSFSLYRSLRSVNPSPFLFYLKFPDFSFMGSSPEIMVSLKENLVTVRPLAGTRKRGTNPQEDERISKELLADKKELAEHLMLIDLGRHDAGRVCKTGTVQVTKKMIIEYYSHVMHISSNVEGQLRDDLDALDALISAFPAGTVSGAPKIRAMQIIEELESVKRSFYAGCVGYFAGNGDMETCITLRSALVKNNKLYLQAGAGVVYDSIPESEYQECQNKLAALITAVNQLHKY
jgi:anthranilate synthase component 1